jgi:hypothetical protein
MLRGMQIEATPRDRESLIALLPEYEGERLPIPIGDLKGREVPAPQGITVRFTGSMEYRSVDTAPDLEFIVDIARGVTVALLATWIRERFRGKVQQFTINRRWVDLDDEGEVRRVIEEEIKSE